MLSARKETGKFSEGVVLSKSMEVLFRAVPPSVYLALAMTESEEKSERYRLMQQQGLSENRSRSGAMRSTGVSGTQASLPWLASAATTCRCNP
jgi:hypothetical protein